MTPRVRLENRPQGRVELRVHQDHVLAVLERLEDRVRAELDRAGHVDDDVDVRRSADQHRVGGHDRPAALDGVIDGRLRISDHRIDRRVRVTVAVYGLLDATIEDRHEPDSARAVQDLVRDAARHEARAEHGDADRPPFGFSCRERRVEDDHCAATPTPSCIRSRIDGSRSASRGQLRSLSDMSVAGSGHSIASRGSEYRSPLSAPGV